MKKIFFFLLLLSLSGRAFTQPAGPAQQLAGKDYLKKSKRQQRTATILLIASPVLVITPLVISSGKKGGGDATTIRIVYSSMAAGFLAFPVSIGFFIASSACRKKALRLSFKSETVPYLSNRNLLSRAVPTLNLKISI